jgi:hypothetical protein
MAPERGWLRPVGREPTPLWMNFLLVKSRPSDSIGLSPVEDGV